MTTSPTTMRSLFEPLPPGSQEVAAYFKRTRSFPMTAQGLTTLSNSSRKFLRPPGRHLTDGRSHSSSVGGSSFTESQDFCSGIHVKPWLWVATTSAASGTCTTDPTQSSCRLVDVGDLSPLFTGIHMMWAFHKGRRATMDDFQNSSRLKKCQTNPTSMRRGNGWIPCFSPSFRSHGRGF